MIFEAVGESEFLLSTPSDFAYNEFKSEDINKDGKVDIIDLSTVAKEYNIMHPSYEDIINNNYVPMYNDFEKFDMRCDLNRDYVIDIYDLVSIAKGIE